MDEQLKVRLLSYLDNLEAAAKKGQEFAATEIPETIREWLLWMAVENFTYAALGLIPAMIVAYIMLKVHQYVKTLDEGWRSGEGAYASCQLVLTLILFGTLGASVHYAMKGVKVLVAPRVVIVEKLSEGGGPLRLREPPRGSDGPLDEADGWLKAGLMGDLFDADGVQIKEPCYRANLKTGVIVVRMAGNIQKKPPIRFEPYK